MRYILVLLLSFSTATFAQPHLMALQTYDEQEVSGWLVSEKLDGVRAYWNGKQLLTRSGGVYHAPSWFINALPRFELDGELWLGRNQFEQTVSIVRQHQPDSRWQKIQYHIFDVPQAEGGLLQRLAKLDRFLALHRVDHLKVVPHYPFNDPQELPQMLDRLVQQGAEGLVLREPNVAYPAGRTNYALKLKPKYDAECRVTGYTEGKGKYLGLVGALICVNDQDQELKLGSGLTDQQRKQPPKIGTLVSYQYVGYTQKGWPRHAVFWRVRSDMN